MNFKFEKLIIWQKAMDYGEKIYSLTKKFPKDEENIFHNKNLIRNMLMDLV